MNSFFETKGKSASLHEILDDREKRQTLQQNLLKSYPTSLISFTLNIAGDRKCFPLAKHTFETGLEEIHKQLLRFHCLLIHTETHCGASGYLGLLCVDAPACELKLQLAELEETHPLGRLFDIDVLDVNGVKISRTGIGLPKRSCLLCDKPAFTCSRNHTHTPEELLSYSAALMKQYSEETFANTISSLFMKAMIYEVTTTPKPGLVDADHNGAHKDMDIALFIDSSHALRPYFYNTVLAGIRAVSLSELFPMLRTLGLAAEITMIQATHGINTHKGLIFSGGILCGALGFLYRQSHSLELSALSEICRQMLVTLKNDFKELHEKKPVSHGEYLYVTYGLKGIRGEAMNGFPQVFYYALPEFHRAIKKGYTLFESGRITLLHCIAYAEDTNIIIRSDYDTWKSIQSHVQDFLLKHPLGTYHTCDILLQLDKYFMEKNISPGGSADLLALVYFLYFVEQTFTDSLDNIPPA